MNSDEVWVDGHSLSHSFGAGISTYTRGLIKTISEKGIKTGVLLGRSVAANLSLEEADIALFDVRHRSQSLKSRILQLPVSARALHIPSSGFVARNISPSNVDSHFSTGSIPSGTQIYNVNDVYGRGSLHMQLFRRLLSIKARPQVRPKLIHWCHTHPLRLQGSLNVYTIHDLIPLRLPWAAGENKKLWLRTARNIANTADHIITVSEQSRRDIIDLLGVSEEKITNTYQSVSKMLPVMDPHQEVSRLRATFALEPKQFFLFLSNIEPRKNLPRLLDAYYAVQTDTPLVLVGAESLHAGDLLRTLTRIDKTTGERRTPDGRVRYLGYLPRLDVELLLRQAKALLFPSLYEGFGLPAAEAMLAGTAVLTSSTTSLPEVVGEAALTVEPTDIKALIEGIVLLDTNDDYRMRLQEMGPGRASIFSHENHAKRLNEVYNKVRLLS